MRAASPAYAVSCVAARVVAFLVHSKILLLFERQYHLLVCTF